METRFIKQKKDKNYTVLDNTFIKDKTLSLKAKGLMAYILSLPDDWTLYQDELKEHFTDGKDSIRTAFNELKAHGYLEARQQKDSKGRFHSMVYTVIEAPVS